MDDKRIYTNQKRTALFILDAIVLLIILYKRQEASISKSLEDCSFYTIMQPLRMPDQIFLYFDYYYDSKKYESKTSVGADDVGLHFFANNSILSSRYWLRVNCKDFKNNRVLWHIPVPDTLQFVPQRGWKTIPYGLDSLER